MIPSKPTINIQTTANIPIMTHNLSLHDDFFHLFVLVPPSPLSLCFSNLYRILLYNLFLFIYF